MGHLLQPQLACIVPLPLLQTAECPLSGWKSLALGQRGCEPLSQDLRWPISVFLSSPPLPAGPAGLVSGDQRVQVAKSRAQQNSMLLAQELQQRKEQVWASGALPGVRIKEEPLSEEGEEEEEGEPMDTTPSGDLHSRLTNGVPAGWVAGGDSFNGLTSPGCASTPVAQELRAFVETTFQRQFVLTLSELKRLFNLHLASLPPGHTLFSGISDRMLQDTVLAAGCKQILVPVSGACAVGL